ncbi:hypothetical protein [Pseudoalteromonas aurantia]|uniref:STAS/SEC14 domain-containing protein n=1 Tax=Pseudoalteromonas aurantia TaxID=43654 RepID=A0A5S3V6Y5_9GAMM|nr:hypothetical protein [Pseudoalteromonas aurantia]TMO56899.1 hypothetical protein CWC18_18915 [Pseudoalteromonas aurantia]TMO66428.1 hypothetical protein CWC19_16335 [Pseudoalteromonas aurantia]TMO78527.1 hypothetical protein CWC20_01485 [Pseudoalteromonas aurantia]
MTDKTDHTTQQFTYSINSVCPSDIIVVTVKGCGQPKEVIGMYQRILSFAQLHHKDKLLLNVVDLKLHYGGSDVLKVTKVIEQILPNFRVARVVSPADFKSDLIDLFSHNTSLKLKSFFDEHHAIEWLTSA